ncbi:MAG TPA: ATP-binding cassette domain-containing protein [bacterium]|nr:ATP-binding cassette domain-containing protein [bacterium]
MTDPRPIIEVRGLFKRYRRAPAVDGVSLTIASGEIFGLLGPDGAGKSTVLQIAAGVLLPDRGQVLIDGIDVRRDPEAVKRRIGYMPQGLGLSLYDDLTVDEHLRFFAELRGIPEQQFREHRRTLLDIMRLGPAAGRLARHLSGGMRQKLGLASALIHLPDVLLLDEPTTGVDPLSRRDFWQIIDRLSRTRGITVLLTTPYLDEAERCHRVALMHRGRILAAGSPDELKAAATTVAESDRVRIEDVFVALMSRGAGPADASARVLPTPAPSPAAVPGPSLLAGTPPEPAIRVEALTKRFGALTAVNEVSFEVSSGEIFGFLGPNGAGKTTTIKMLAGLLRPTSGRGWVVGYDVSGQVDAIKHTVGYMSQRFSLYGDLTVRENLLFAARIYGLGRHQTLERERTTVDAVGLGEWRHVLARDLPLGIRQRLALAAAIVHEPRVLFLDEPTAGVDPLARSQFWELIGALSHGQGVTVLVSTHYMDEAEHCDRLLFMHDGHIVSIGRADELRRRAVAARGTVLEVASARFREAAAALEPIFPDLMLVGRRVHVFSRHPAGDQRRIEAALGAAVPGSIREIRMSMDDVFATLIERHVDVVPAGAASLAAGTGA